MIDIEGATREVIFVGPEEKLTIGGMMVDAEDNIGEEWHGGRIGTTLTSGAVLCNAVSLGTTGSGFVQYGSGMGSWSLAVDNGKDVRI